MDNFIIFAFGIGVVAGLRSLTAPAAVALAAHAGWLNLTGTRFAFMGTSWAALMFSILALGEFVGDLLPRTPKRTAFFPLIARMVAGGFCGVCLCAAANQSLVIGAIAGAMGACAGAFAGYSVRRSLVTKLNIKDFFVAIPEDLITIALAYFLVSR